MDLEQQLHILAQAHREISNAQGASVQSLTARARLAILDSGYTFIDPIPSTLPISHTARIIPSDTPAAGDIFQGYIITTKDRRTGEPRYLSWEELEPIHHNDRGTHWIQRRYTDFGWETAITPRGTLKPDHLGGLRPREMYANTRPEAAIILNLAKKQKT